MIRCDICNKEHHMSDLMTVKPAQMQGAVKAGYNPIAGLKETAVASSMGVSAERMMEVWQRKVGERKTNWSICPVCHSKAEQYFQKAKKCFIATAAFSDEDAPEVERLRRFRDEVLMPTPAGRAFVRWYYGAGPHLADFLEMHPLFKSPVQAVLRTVARLMR